MCPGRPLLRKAVLARGRTGDRFGKYGRGFRSGCNLITRRCSRLRSSAVKVLTYHSPSSAFIVFSDMRCTASSLTLSSLKKVLQDRWVNSGYAKHQPRYNLDLNITPDRWGQGSCGEQGHRKTSIIEEFALFLFLIMCHPTHNKKNLFMLPVCLGWRVGLIKRLTKEMQAASSKIRTKRSSNCSTTNSQMLFPVRQKYRK